MHRMLLRPTCNVGLEFDRRIAIKLARSVNEARQSVSLSVSQRRLPGLAAAMSPPHMGIASRGACHAMLMRLRCPQQSTSKREFSHLVEGHQAFSLVPSAVTTAAELFMVGTSCYMLHVPSTMNNA